MVAVFLVSLAMPLGGVLKFQALPDLDGDTISARVLMAEGTPLEATERVVEELKAALGRVNERLKPRQPGGRDLVKMVYVKFNENMDAYEAGPHVATVFADLLEAQTRDARLDEVFEVWREELGSVADAQAISFTEPSLAPTGRNIEVRVRGS